MTHLHRRDFLKGCCVAAVAGGVGSRATAYFAPPPIIPATATERHARHRVPARRDGRPEPAAARRRQPVPRRLRSEPQQYARADVRHRRGAGAAEHDLGAASARDRAAGAVSGQSSRVRRRGRPDAAEPGRAQPFRGAVESRVRLRRRRRLGHRLADAASDQRRAAADRAAAGDVDGQHHRVEPARQHRRDHDGERFGFPPRYVPLVVAGRRCRAWPRRRGHAHERSVDRQHDARARRRRHARFARAAASDRFQSVRSEQPSERLPAIGRRELFAELQRAASARSCATSRS